MKFNVWTFVLAGIGIAMPTLAFAGAWNLPPDYNYSQADEAYTDIEFLDPSLEFTKSEVRVFYEQSLVKFGYLQTLEGRNIVKEKTLSLGTWVRY